MSKTKSSKKLNLNKCSPRDFPLKSYFLAPNAENREILVKGINDALERWFNWRKLAHQDDGPFFDINEIYSHEYEVKKEALRKQIAELSEKFGAEIPRHSPRYIGHMYSEFTIPAFLGHMLALMYNPNNISSESSRVGLDIEKQAIAMLAHMVGYPKESVGHFTSGGTVANLEMLYRAKLRALSDKNAKGPLTLIVPESAHYSWEKGLRLIGERDSRIVKIPLDPQGRLNTKALAKSLNDHVENGACIWGVVSILGATELGVLDPIEKVNEILSAVSKKYKTKIWHHVDAAYGGFLASMLRGEQTQSLLTASDKRALNAIRYADSITLDPHKLGYTPYASGCFICRNSADYKSTSQEAPYLDYKSNFDPGPFTIEGSRTAAGALAIYLTAKTLGLEGNGLGKILARSVESAKILKKNIKSSKRFVALDVDGLNIVCFASREKVSSLSKMNKNTEALYKRMKAASEKAGKPYYVSKTVLDEGYRDVIERHCKKWKINMDANELFLIRCTLMNPFFRTKHSKTDFAEDFVSWASAI